MSAALRFSKTKLRSLSVILASYQLLHMETNGLVEKPNNSLQKELKDISLDLSSHNEAELEQAIKEIEAIAVSILKASKIHKKDESFFIDTTSAILNAFFETQMLKVGVSTHLIFCVFLFVYFVENPSKKHGEVFSRLTNPDIFYKVFDKINESNVLDWSTHYDSSVKALTDSICYKSPSIAIKQPLIFPWHVKLIKDGIKYECTLKASSQNEAKRIVEKNNPELIAYLVVDGNDHRLKRKKYSVPKKHFGIQQAS